MSFLGVVGLVTFLLPSGIVWVGHVNSLGEYLQVVPCGESSLGLLGSSLGNGGTDGTILLDITLVSKERQTLVPCSFSTAAEWAVIAVGDMPAVLAACAAALPAAIAANCRVPTAALAASAAAFAALAGVEYRLSLRFVPGALERPLR